MHRSGGRTGPGRSSTSGVASGLFPRGCAAPSKPATSTAPSRGCRVQVDRTHAHHVREREHGRDTSLANLVLLCLRHHHVVHEGGWVITPRADTSPGTTGYWELAPPDRQTQP